MVSGCFDFSGAKVWGLRAEHRKMLAYLLLDSPYEEVSNIMGPLFGRPYDEDSLLESVLASPIYEGALNGG